jgi:CheY-like chemotaxis protein
MQSDRPIVMLSVDDKALTSELDRAGYRKMGVLVKVAASYADVTKILEAHAIDVIVINLDYAKVDGLSIVKHLSQTSKIPIITTSVQSSSALGRKAVQAGAAVFIEQPIPRQHFIEKIKQALNQAIRDSDRIAIHGTAEFSWKNKMVECEIGDLSTTGILIYTDLKIPQDSALSLQLNLPEANGAIIVEGILVRILEAEPNRNIDRTGIAIRFGKFTSDGKKRLGEFLRKSARTDSQMAYYL